MKNINPQIVKRDWYTARLASHKNNPTTKEDRRLTVPPARAVNLRPHQTHQRKNKPKTGAGGILGWVLLGELKLPWPCAMVSISYMAIEHGH